MGPTSHTSERETYFICRMFNQQELQILLGGVNAPVDLDDLRAFTNYGGLYNENEPTIQMFWKVGQI